MRLASIVIALAALAACQDKPATNGTERSSAAGQVLGGEVTDDMLPLDTVQSTSPADPRAGVPDAAGESDSATTAPEPNPGPLPSPDVSGEPQGRQPAGSDATPEPPSE